MNAPQNALHDSDGVISQTSPSFDYPFAARASMTQIVTISVVFGAAIWGLIGGLDLVAAHFGAAAVVPMSAFDSLVGVACGILLFKLMLSERSRCKRMAARLRTVAEINHHVRNALEGIEMTAYVTHNQQLIADIDTGIKRIEWAIQELLPETAEKHESRRRQSQTRK